jgi:hypothetical protein
MSIFQSTTSIPLNIEAFRTGLAWAQSWTPDGAVLCTLGHRTLRLTAVDDKKFLATWTYPMPNAPDAPLFFLLPRFIVQTMCSPAVWNATGLQVILHKNLVGMIIHEGKQEFRLQWRWTASDFKAPRAFARMNLVPDIMTNAPYVAVADIVHLAIASLIQTLEAEEPTPQQDAVLIDFAPSLLNIGGSTVSSGTNGTTNQYYFNSRMVLRGLEIVRENQISFSIQPIRDNQQAILYFACRRKNWQIHCALLSVGTKQVKTDIVMQIRETRPPMMDGAWVLPTRS